MIKSEKPVSSDLHFTDIFAKLSNSMNDVKPEMRIYMRK